MLRWNLRALTGLAAAGLLLAGANAATAAPIITYDGTTATNIEDLEVDGVLYDVAFVLDSSNGLYGGSFDFTGAGDAEAAANAINAALNDEDIADTVGPDAGTCSVPILCGTYGIGYDLDGAFTLIQGGSFLLGNWTGVGDSFVSTDNRIYADFELADGTPAPTIDFSADPEVIQFGESSTLSWNVQNATSCTGSMGSGGWAGDKDPVSGSEQVSPMVTSTYVLTCDGAGGESDADVTVTVPEPGAALAMLAALAGLGVVGRMRRRS